MLRVEPYLIHRFVPEAVLDRIAVLRRGHSRFDTPDLNAEIFRLRFGGRVGWYRDDSAYFFGDRLVESGWNLLADQRREDRNRTMKQTRHWCARRLKSVNDQPRESYAKTKEVKVYNLGRELSNFRCLTEVEHHWAQSEYDC